MTLALWTVHINENVWTNNQQKEKNGSYWKLDIFLLLWLWWWTVVLCCVLHSAVYAQEFSLSVSDPLIRGPVTKCYARIAAPLRKLLCKLVNNLLSPANISVSKCLFDLTTGYNIHYVLNVKSLFLDPLPMCKLDFYLISKPFGLDPQMENWMDFIKSEETKIVVPGVCKGQ